MLSTFQWYIKVFAKVCYGLATQMKADVQFIPVVFFLFVFQCESLKTAKYSFKNVSPKK